MMAKILVAEDDRHIVRVITLWLTRNGHEVIAARSRFVHVLNQLNFSAASLANISINRHF